MKNFQSVESTGSMYKKQYQIHRVFLKKTITRHAVFKTQNYKSLSKQRMNFILNLNCLNHCFTRVSQIIERHYGLVLLPNFNVQKGITLITKIKSNFTTKTMKSHASF